MITGKMYDLLKWVTLVVAPALGSFILGAGVLLEWEGSAKIAGVIALFATFLGAILQVSSAKFKTYLKTDEAFDGYVTPGERDDDTGIPAMGFTISRHPEDFLDRDFVRLKVGTPPRNPVQREPLPEAEVAVAPEKHDGPS